MDQLNISFENVSVPLPWRDPRVVQSMIIQKTAIKQLEVTVGSTLSPFYSLWTRNPSFRASICCPPTEICQTSKQEMPTKQAWNPQVTSVQTHVDLFAFI